MNRSFIAACAAGAACIAGGAVAPRAQAQPAGGGGSPPIHATITGVGAAALIVKTQDGQAKTLTVTPATRVEFITKRSMADLKPGAFVGSGAMTAPDGTLHAQEVHIFAQPGLGEGHRQMGTDPLHTMTNATVVAVTSAEGGKTLTMDYKGGEQKVMVAPTTPIVAMQAGKLADLRPGMAVTVMVQGDTALAIMTGKGGAKPPL